MTSEEKLIKLLEVDNAKTHQVTIGPHTINYLTAGSGDPLLLIHGGNIGWGQWYPNIPVLTERFNVIAIDLPGAGRSSRINYSHLDLENDFVEIVSKFILYLKLPNFSIIGSSIGGWISLKLAFTQNFKIDHLVVADSIGFTDYVRFSDRIIGIYPLVRILSSTVLKPRRENKNIEKFLRSVFYNHELDIAPEFIDYFYDTMRTSHNLLLICRLSSVWGMRPELMFDDDTLSRVTMPVMVIWGQQDKLMPVDKNKAHIKMIPQVDLQILNDAGHIPSIEQADNFNRLILNFLTRS